MTRQPDVGGPIRHGLGRADLESEPVPDVEIGRLTELALRSPSGRTVPATGHLLGDPGHQDVVTWVIAATTEPDAEKTALKESDQKPPADRRRRSWHDLVRAVAVRLSIVGLAVLVTLVLVELAFRVLGYQPLYGVYSRPEAFFKQDPELGWSLQPGARGTFVGPRPFPISFRTEVRINSLGLRGPEITPVPSGGLRVLVLGDSWTAGFEVPEQDTWASVLQGQLQGRLGVPVQVINGGVRGYGTDQELLLYRERLAELKPNLVLDLTTGNDPGDDVTLHRMHRVFGKPAFLLGAGGSLELAGRPVPRYPQCSEYRVIDGVPERVDGTRARLFCWIETKLVDHSAFFSFLTLRLQSHPKLLRWIYGLGAGADEGEEGGPPRSPKARGTPTAGRAGGGATATPSGGGAAGAGSQRRGHHLDYAHRLTSVLVETLAREVRANGGEFALAGTSWDLGRLDTQTFRREGIPLLQIDAALNHANVLIPHDGHPNEAGHRLIAEVLADQLVSILQPMIK